DPSSCFGARLPASGQTAMVSRAWCRRSPRDFSGLDPNRPDAPDLLGVLPDGSIARKLPHVGRVENGLLCPPGRIAVAPRNLILAFDVRRIIGQNEVRISAREEAVDDRREEGRVATTESPRPDHVQHPGKLRVAAVMLGWAIAWPEGLHLV